MNGICGWVSTSSDQDSSFKAINRMLSAQSLQRTACQFDSGPNWGVGVVGLHPGSIDMYTADGLTTAVVGQPHFTDPELESLRLQGKLAQALAVAYRHDRENAFAKLTGAFSIIIIDHTRHSAAIAVDRMAVHSLTYTVAGNTFLFATACDAINAHPAAKPEIDLQALYDYLYFHMIPAPRTVYRDYHRLLPAQYAIFEKGGMRLGQYWSMHFEEDRHAPFDVLKKDFLSTLEEAVHEASTDRKTGCFLSGGTDSSTMAGLLGQVTGEAARTYSIGFNEPGYDEMGYARIAARHFGTDHHEYYVTPEDIVSAIPLIAEGYDQPFGNSSAVPTYYCARMAKADGVERLIGGDGGDELFGGNERYAKQYLFSLYENLPTPLRNGFIEPLLCHLPGAGRLPVLRKAKSYVEQASVPMPARLETYNLLDRIGQQQVLTPGFLSHIDSSSPLKHINRIYHKADANSLINRMLALDLRITLADNDLPKVVNTCALAGMEVTFPMLADPVVAFSARLAPQLKLKGTKLRYFFKEALRGFLPDDIINKQKHGFGLPFGPWLTKHRPLQTLVADSLKQLKGRRVVQPAFVDELIARHLSIHAGYYGTMVWVLVILELWLQKHGQENFRID